MRDYHDQMNRRDNEYRVYMNYAEEEYNKNKCHTKEEIAYLQKAIMAQAEMAQLSIGEERKYHSEIQHTLSVRLAEAVREADPAYYSSVVNKNALGSGRGSMPSKSDPKKNSGNGGGRAKSDDGISEETVAYWHKECPKHSFADVDGMEKLQEQLKACVAEEGLSNIRKYFQLPELHSYLFYGPPGCGKTYIIEAFIHELMQNGYQYLSLDCADILSRYVGSAEKIIRRVFDEAEQCAPCVVFLDEIDGVCKNRNMRDLPVWASNMTTAFLTAYNRINSSGKKIILIGATNYPTQVDSAMIDRAELILVPYPDKPARSAAFDRIFGKLIAPEDGFGWNDMGALTETFNHRDIGRLGEKIKNMVIKDSVRQYGDEEKAMAALKDGSYTLTREIFETAMENYNPSPKEAVNEELAHFAKLQADAQMR